MSTYDDEIIEPAKLKSAYLRRLYARINRGLQDSYEQGYALLSNYWVATPDGVTLLSSFNNGDLPNVKQWLEETGYTVEPYQTAVWFKEPPEGLQLYRVTWPQ